MIEQQARCHRWFQVRQPLVQLGDLLAPGARGEGCSAAHGATRRYRLIMPGSLGHFKHQRHQQLPPIDPAQRLRIPVLSKLRNPCPLRLRILLRKTVSAENCPSNHCTVATKLPTEF